MTSKRFIISLLVGPVSLMLLQSFWGLALAMSFRVDQTGYHSGAQKIAVLEDVPFNISEPHGYKILLVGPPDKKDKLLHRKEKILFEVTDVRDFKDKSKVGPGGYNWIVDFSNFKTPGIYNLKVEGANITSPPIKISDYLYWDTLKPVVRTFYLQRCGQAIHDSVTNISHEACHIQDGLIASGRSIEDATVLQAKDVAGGWHDGSDYGKYTTSTSIASAKLMALYEWNPKPFQYFSLEYPISEENLGDAPDLIHEAKIGLGWLLTMQRRDGGFYRKVAGKVWPRNLRPEDDDQDRFIFGVTTQDTASAVASLAMASRTFKKKDLGYTVKTLIAAEQGWLFLKNHPNSYMESSPSETTGSSEYLNIATQGNDLAYRVWAAAELYLATKKAPYHQYFLTHYQNVLIQPISWQNPALQGLVDYVLYGGEDKDPEADSFIRQSLIKAADPIVARIQKSPYSVGIRHFTKESNLQIVEQAALLMATYRMTSQEKYRNAATHSIHYLFGMNPLGKSFVTNIGNDFVKFPTHPLVKNSKKSISGLLVSGANTDSKDGKTPKGLEGLSYVDDAEATDSNDTKILYNAGLAYILGVLNTSYNSGSMEPPPKVEPGPSLPPR